MNMLAPEGFEDKIILPGLYVVSTPETVDKLALM